MVRMKMEQKEYIILCLEDSNDWSNATTRRLVMQVSCGKGFSRGPPGPPSPVLVPCPCAHIAAARLFQLCPPAAQHLA